MNYTYEQYTWRMACTYICICLSRMLNHTNRTPNQKNSGIARILSGKDS
jgi:hypothetical protein